MHLRRLWLADFRNYSAADVAPAPSGLTVVRGDNGEGKTNLLEAVGYLATLQSFRGVPTEALVREGVPFRAAHEQVAESVRDGSYEAPAPAARPAPGPGGAAEAVAAARARLESV